MWPSIVARLVHGRMPWPLFGIIVLATFVLLAGMTIRGGYNLKIRSHPLDIELNPGVRS